MRSRESKDTRLCVLKAGLALCNGVSESNTVTLYIKSCRCFLKDKTMHNQKVKYIPSTYVLNSIISALTCCIKSIAGRNKVGNELQWLTLIIRMFLSMVALYVQCSGKMLITTVFSDTICFANKHCSGCQRGNGITFKVVHIEWIGEWCCWVSTCIPKVGPIIPLYSHTVYSPYIRLRFNPRFRKGRLR